VRFALLSVGKKGHQTLLLRLSILLRNALATCGPLITPGKCWRKITWPEFQPSLPPGLLGVWGCWVHPKYTGVIVFPIVSAGSTRPGNLSPVTFENFTFFCCGLPVFPILRLIGAKASRSTVTLVFKSNQFLQAIWELTPNDRSRAAELSSLCNTPMSLIYATYFLVNSSEFIRILITKYLSRHGPCISKRRGVSNTNPVSEH
jgi:hypothetical protein